MNKNLKICTTLLLLTLILLIPALLLAQGGPVDPNDVPIDGGLSLLLAAGAAYGVKKYRDYKKTGGVNQSESTAEK